jgi:hypothetical protein
MEEDVYKSTKRKTFYRSDLPLTEWLLHARKYNNILVQVLLNLGLINIDWMINWLYMFQ